MEKNISYWLMPCVNYKLTPEKILKDVCLYFNVRKSDLASRCRKKEIVIPRQVYMIVSSLCTLSSIVEISKIINRDHSTLIAAKKNNYSKHNLKPTVDNFIIEHKYKVL